jgi:uncharacterized protein (TIGR02246 family)
MCNRSVCRLLSLLPVIVLAGGCAPGRNASPAPDPAAITAEVESFVAANNAAIAARDTAAVAALYTDDATVLPAGAPRVEGRAAIRAMWARSLRAPGLAMTLKSQRQLVSASGDMVTDIGTYDFRVEGPGGQPVHDVGKYVTVMQKVDGRWKMAVDIWNSDPAQR